MRPILPPTPLNPESRASPQDIDDSERTAQEHKGKPKTGMEKVQEADPSFNIDGQEAVRRTREGDTGLAVETQGLAMARRIKGIMHDECLSHRERQLQVQAIWAVYFAEVNMPGPSTNCRAEPDPPPIFPGPVINAPIDLEVLPLEYTPDTTCHVTPATLTPANKESAPNPQRVDTGTPDSAPDILIQTPGGPSVPAHEVLWEPNPRFQDGGDNLLLLEVVPGHYLFHASPFAVDLCALTESDLRSQFYKLPPIEEASTSSPPSPWSDDPRGNGATIKRRERYAAQKLARVAKEKDLIISSVMEQLVKDVMTGFRNGAIAPRPSQEPGRPETDLGAPSMPQASPPIAGETISYDHNLYYRNGNPKPKIDPTARPLPRGLTSKARKRLGGRNSKRRRNKRRRPSCEDPVASNTATIDTRQGGDEPTLIGSDIILPSPGQHMATIPGSTPAILTATEGADFGPNTGLPDQDPLRWEANANSQQIGSLTYPEDIRTQLGLRQDLRFGHARFSPGDVETLSNGELILKNTTGDIPPKKKKRPGTGPQLLQALTPSPDTSPGAVRLIHSEPTMGTTLNKAHTSGEPDQGIQEKSIPISSEATSSRSLWTDTNGDQARLASGKAQPKSNMEYATKELESIDQVTFIKMAGDTLKKMKKTTHYPMTARPTPPIPVTKPQLGGGNAATAGERLGTTLGRGGEVGPLPIQQGTRDHSLTHATRREPPPTWMDGERDEERREDSQKGRSGKSSRQPHMSRELRMLDHSVEPLPKRVRRPARGMEYDNSCEVTRLIDVAFITS